MKRVSFITIVFSLGWLLLTASNYAKAQLRSGKANSIDLSGNWRFAIDSLDKGIKDKWFNQKLGGHIMLPGSMTTNGLGTEIALTTDWTGSIQDSSYFLKPEWAKFRQTGNLKIPFWLQPEKYYKGAAWYQKEVVIPASWQRKQIDLFIERSHWETILWVDDKEIGMQNSLAAPHIFDISKYLTPGRHIITVRVDNRVKDIVVGINSHSISDHTQSNWNGMVGRLSLNARPLFYLENCKIFPDAKNRMVVVRTNLRNNTGIVKMVNLKISVYPPSKTGPLKTVTWTFPLNSAAKEMEFEYPMPDKPLLWDEFSPNLYTLNLQLGDNVISTEENFRFGFRNLETRDSQLLINDRPLFLRGTLECAVFPKTGFPPTDRASWLQVYNVCKKYGLNHIRFHSWCPPAAAFEAADEKGMYLHVECSSWANSGSSLGDGKPIDQYIFDESRKIVEAYGNHPSFCMLAYGNEPAGSNQVKYLADFVNYWKNNDPRRIYTSGAGWPIIPENDFNSSPEPRIQGWGAGLTSIINAEPPSTNFDWQKIIIKWRQPVVSHEIGQWCAYPDFKEIKKYRGVLKAKNFEIFREILKTNGMEHLADSFLLASGKLQALCYKADVEAALRTPKFGGFQLLGLNDFPGQGTALVGVVNAFWQDKGYVTGSEFSRFCSSVVPLARLKKMIFENDDTLIVPVQIANFSSAPLMEKLNWSIRNEKAEVLFKGQLKNTSIPIGNAFFAGEIRQSLSTIMGAERLTLTIAVGNHENSWDIFVYPAHKEEFDNDILITQQLDNRAVKTLENGGKVLLTIKKGSMRPEKGAEVMVGFSSIFWNTAWTNKQPPHTLGILCNPAHPALKYFPTQYYSNYQWWDAMNHCEAIRLDAVSKKIEPIVRIIDDWFTARPLAMIFECKAGKGKLMVTGVDLLTNYAARPEAKQLLFSLKKYMTGTTFNPTTDVSIRDIQSLMQ